MNKQLNSPVRSNKESQRLQESEVYTQPLLAYIRYIYQYQSFSKPICR